MSGAPDVLFSKYDLRGVLDRREQAILKETDAVEPSRLLNTNTEDWCDYLEDKYRVEPLALNESDITVDQAEAKIDVSGDFRRAVFDRGQPFYISGTQVRFHVPYSGEKDLLPCHPTTWTTSFPAAVIGDAELVFVYATADHDGEAIKHEFERDLSLTRQWMGWVNSDVGQFNGRVRNLARKRVEARKAKLLKDQGMVASLGYPLKRASAAPTTYAVPAVRRRLPSAPVPAGSAPFKPEPTLPMTDYEHILAIITSMVSVMERSPKSFATMQEENLRDHFLVQLNGQYEGQATGETFNGDGKTDILIRVDDKNVFIAECKFWNGPAKLSEAIDQLLGYASWRDTKTALLVFNRNRSLTTILEKLPLTVKEHPNCKRQVECKYETGFRFVFGHRDDPNRELTLTMLVFEVPK
ncbi:MAG: hypothetical protein NTX53_13205 [candidate division WOR-3 bacterium]|nr:hypothetical protein [candidate division WOR-3 bacterium]